MLSAQHLNVDCLELLSELEDGTTQNKCDSVIPLETLWHELNLMLVRGKAIHPTQKPVDLFEYMLNIYAPPGGTVLDVASGSGTTAIATMNLWLWYICMKKDQDIYAAADKRIKEHREQ